MKNLVQFIIAYLAFSVVGAHRFGYSAAEQRLWKKKHEVMRKFCDKN